MKIDLTAPIFPGESAAGLPLGARLEDCTELFAGHKVVHYYPGFNLVDAIRNNVGVMRLEAEGDNGTTFFVGPETLRLTFSVEGQLSCIDMFAGYLGTYRGVGVGDALSKISSSEAVEYDDGDDMYYRVDEAGSIIPGLAIVAVKADVADHAETFIDGFCVHDWSMA